MNIEEQISSLQKRVEAIEKRNKRVELDKRWEQSLLRRIIVAILTYCVVSLFFLMTKTSHPFLAALVPTMGFVISTLSLSLLKDIWKEKQR